jgi:hypothetical protein
MRGMLGTPGNVGRIANRLSHLIVLQPAPRRLVLGRGAVGPCDGGGLYRRGRGRLNAHQRLPSPAARIRHRTTALVSWIRNAGYQAGAAPARTVAMS